MYSDDERIYNADVYFLHNGPYYFELIFSRSFRNVYPQVGNGLTYEGLERFGIVSISTCVGALGDYDHVRKQYSDITSNIQKTEITTPKVFEYQLGPIYPVPCNGCNKAAIHYSIGNQGAPTTLDVYNISGQKVRQLTYGQSEPGEYRLEWDLTDGRGIRLPSAPYIIQMRSKDYVARERYVIIK